MGSREGPQVRRGVFFLLFSSVLLLQVPPTQAICPFFPGVKSNLRQTEMDKKINHHPSAEHGKLKGRKKLHLPLHSIYQSNLCHNHSACFHTYSVLTKINLCKPVIAFFVRIFKKWGVLESGSIRGKAGLLPHKITHSNEAQG